MASPTDRVVSGEGQRLIACWHCGFESRRGHGCVSLVRVVCCQVESLRRADFSSRGIVATVLCHLETSRMRQPWPTLGCSTRMGGGDITCNTVVGMYVLVVCLAFLFCILKVLGFEIRPGNNQCWARLFVCVRFNPGVISLKKWRRMWDQLVFVVIPTA